MHGRDRCAHTIRCRNYVWLKADPLSMDSLLTKDACAGAGTVSVRGFSPIFPKIGEVQP